MPPPEHLNDTPPYYYHSIDLPGGESHDGDFDLRPGIDHYVASGAVHYSGKRVLELGPASGFVAFALEARGATVTSVELDCSRYSLDILPWLDTPEYHHRAHENVLQMQVAYWRTHELLHSANRLHCGSVYQLPDSLGRFDIAHFGAILLHLRHPLDALQEAARLADSTIVITEILPVWYRFVRGNFSEFNPCDHVDPNRWWSFGPDYFVPILAGLGFANTSVHFHTQRTLHSQTRRYRDQEMFTLVASREPATALPNR